MTHEMTCIICPNGCDLTVTEENGRVTVTGNACKNGAVYGEQEVSCPRRTLTTTVRVLGGSLPLVSARSESPIRKEELLPAMEKLKGLTVQAPVKLGQVLFEDSSLGLKLLATKNIAKV